MHWRDRFLYCMEAVNRAQAMTGEVKGTYLNVTAGTMEDMYERAEFAKQLGSVIVMIDLVIGYTAIQSMSKWARRNDMILHLHRAGHGTYTRQKTHGVSLPRHRQVDAAGRRRPHPCRHRGRQARGRPAHDQGFYDICREAYNPRRWSTASSSTRTGPSMRKVMPVASGGIHAGQMHQLLHYLGEDCVLQFGGGTIGHPMGIAGRRHRQPRGARGHDPGPQRGPRHHGGGPGDPGEGGQATARRWPRRSTSGRTSPSTTRRPTRPTSSPTATAVLRRRSHRPCASPRAPSASCPT